MNNGINLDELIKHYSEEKSKGKVNITLLKYLHRGQDKSFAISLPGNLNGSFLKEIVTGLSAYRDKSCCVFDPVGKGDDETYEYLGLNGVGSQWAYLKKLIQEANLYKEKSELAPIATLSITQLSIDNSPYAYYLGRQQTPTDKFLKRNHVLMSSNDELEDKTNNKVFLFSCDVDFVVREDDDGNGHVFIFNRVPFYKIFNYDEEMKVKATRDVEQIKKWSFLDSTDLIYRKLSQKNVYHRLAKVFSDPVYLDQISKTSPAVLKKNLLERSDGKFDETDFEGDKIFLTDQNIDKVMKMIAKGFRYNFFTNRAEET